jgi:4-alpha-glucanotransferase
MNTGLRRLAAAAGIELSWRDAAGKMQVVSADSLRAVLGALGLPAGSEAQTRESYGALNKHPAKTALPLVTASLNRPTLVPGSAGRFRITLESGTTLEGVARPERNGVRLPAIAEPGYHQAEINGAVTTIAVAPTRGYTLEDAGEAQKLWGLAVQLYALRRKNDGGIGDFAALGDFVREAAGHGADAVAISPVHAQFSADLTHYAPYSASNRAALNSLYAPLDVPEAGSDDLIDWPAAAAHRLQILRANFRSFHDDGALDDFRRQAGAEVERHALFEALFATFSDDNPAGRNFRNWPPAYRNPGSAAVARFASEHQQEIRFHIWLQYLADRGLAQAQKAARDSGMKIGLITDLAVGSDPTGSHSWTRQDEILEGLEIGAPPDLFNRAGQNWGITAFSPRGLRQNGFAAFIDMMRHGLRHAGGLRIDHVMGLTRLWVVPTGFPSAEGVYLRMPMDDLTRLVMLEAQRHRAVVLGEDLGTVPLGFRKKLDAAGIAGLRVLWFERRGPRFTPPQRWHRSAAAMTTTHDLPSVAGWWQGTDIAWRNKLGIAGDSAETREADRTALWSAFRRSGASTGPAPAVEDGAAAADAACRHLGRAACKLVLLPIEDALALPEQPNLPGTIDEHPNWRRRLPADSQTLFARADVTARLAALNDARKL